MGVNDFLLVANNAISKKGENIAYKAVINSGLAMYRKLNDTFEINDDTFELFVYDNDVLKIDDVITDGMYEYVLKKRLETYEGISHWLMYRIGKDKLVGYKGV